MCTYVTRRCLRSIVPRQRYHGRPSIQGCHRGDTGLAHAGVRGACVHASQHACACTRWWRRPVYTKVNLDYARLYWMLRRNSGERRRREGATMIIINVAYPRFAPSLSLSLFLSHSTFALAAVHALPAVPLICRFVCAFKHDSSRCGAMEQREATKRDGVKNECWQGGNGARKKQRGRKDSVWRCRGEGMIL